MPEERSIPAVWVSSCTATGQQSFVSDWCRNRPVWGIAGPGTAAFLADFSDLYGGRVPLCRLKNSSHPTETAGWLFQDGCVAQAALCPAQAVSVTDLSADLPASLRPTLALRARRQQTLCQQAASFLRAAGQLLRQTADQALPSIDTRRIERYAARLAIRERGETGKGVFRCFLSCISPEGHSTDYTLLTALCPRIYVIEDETVAAGHRLTEALYRRLAASGQTLLAGICPVTGRVDHLLLPDTGVGFTLSGPWHRVDFPVYHRIHSSRFYRTESLRRSRRQYSLCLRGTEELIREAVRCLAAAHRLHRENEAAAAGILDLETLKHTIRFWE